MKFFYKLFLVLPAVILLAGAGQGASPISDTQKLETVMALYRADKTKFPDVLEISAEKILSPTSLQPFLFIDIREPGEQAVSMIPGAVSRERFLENPAMARGKTVVAYCTIGTRSGYFSQEMVRRGIRIVNLSGGILAWLHAGGKVYDADGETRQVHVYGKDWDLAPEGYETITFSFWERLRLSLE